MPIQPAPDLVIADRFRLTHLLGRGGMGSVWHAVHLGLDIPCAVKFIEGEGAHMPEVQARFEREAKAAALLRSPHVVQILDHGVWGGTPYIAMELLEGEDLGKRLARVGRLAPPDLLWIIAQVCRALTKAHAQSIVHRDLKPDNIFIVRDDDREIAKVLDFGIAKASGPSTPGGGTRTGAMLGTPYYMSPEQAQGTKTVDSRSDLWSLAVIAFEALTGRRPFESEALGDLLMKIIVAPIPMPSQYVTDLPPAFDAWWLRASQRDPARRFFTAKELCDALELVFSRPAGDAVADRPPAPPPGPTPAPRTASPPHVAASTGAPIATTFGARPPGVRRTSVVVLVAGGLAVAGLVGASVATRGKGAVPAPPAVATTGAVAPTDARAPEPRATVALPAAAASSETVAAVPALSAPTPVAKPAFIGKGPALGKPTAASKPAPAPQPAVVVPPPSPPPAEEKRKTVDLGI